MGRDVQHGRTRTHRLGSPVIRQKAYRSGVASVQWIILGAVCIVVALAGWWFSQSPTKLTKDHYATTLALYRVCNQRSEEGLDQVEALLNMSSSSADDSDPALAAIQSIVADAREDRWQQAAKACRKLLDSQVQR